MNDASRNLFSQPVGGYRRLDSFTLATIIQIETWRFCPNSSTSATTQKAAGSTR